MSISQSPPPPVTSPSPPPPSTPSAPPATPVTPVTTPIQYGTAQDLQQTQQAVSDNNSISNSQANINLSARSNYIGQHFGGAWAANKYGKGVCAKDALEAKAQYSGSNGWSNLNSGDDYSFSLAYRKVLGGSGNCEDRLEAEALRDQQRHEAKLTQLCFQMIKEGLKSAKVCQDLGIEIAQAPQPKPQVKVIYRDRVVYKPQPVKNGEKDCLREDCDATPALW